MKNITLKKLIIVASGFSLLGSSTFVASEGICARLLAMLPFYQKKQPTESYFRKFLNDLPEIPSNLDLPDSLGFFFNDIICEVNGVAIHPNKLKKINIENNSCNLSLCITAKTLGLILNELEKLQNSSKIYKKIYKFFYKLTQQDYFIRKLIAQAKNPDSIFCQYINTPIIITYELKKEDLDGETSITLALINKLSLWSKEEPTWSISKKHFFKLKFMIYINDQPKKN